MPHPCLEAAAIARHDLGKYVCFETRWVGIDGSQEDLSAALCADLLRTRSASGVVVDAVSLWEQLRPGLEGVGETDVDLRAVDQAMEDIAQALPGLRAGGLDTQALKACARQALVVSEHLNALYRRLKEE